MTDTIRRLAQGDDVEVRQVKHERRGAVYPGRVVHRDGGHLIVAAVWVESVDIGHVRFEPGDRSIEHYWTDRWFAVWQVHDATGRLKGWYCNVARPVDIDDRIVTSIDLELDLWVSADGRTVVRLDEDELISSGLPQRDPHATAKAVSALDHLESLGADGIREMLRPRPLGDATPLSSTTLFRAGDVVVIRTVTNGSIRCAAPAIVVSDTDDEIVYFRPTGTVNKVTHGTLVTSSRRDRELALRDELRRGRFELIDHQTRGPGALVVARAGQWHSTWLRPDNDSDAFRPAYVKIEGPHRRTPIGFDVDDLNLDIEVSVDLDWWLKHGGDLDERCADGIYTVDEVRSIRAAAATAIIQIETRQRPFAGSAMNWHPDPTWSTPVLCRDWDAHL